MEKSNPVVMLDGREKVIRMNPDFALERAARFLPGRIEFVGAPTSRATIFEGSPGTIAATTGTPNFIELKIKSDVPLRHVFLVFVSFDPNFFRSRDPESGELIVAHEVPDLRPGQETSIRFSVGYYFMSYFIQVFADGVEVRTEHQEMASRYYSKIEQLRLANLIALFRKSHPGVDKPAVPVMQIKPDLPAGLSVPKSVTTRFIVTAEGLVDNIEIADPVDPTVETAVREALAGWLFLPRFKHGEPVGTKLQMPIEF